MKYTTVIATHNRLYCIEKAIESAFAEFPDGEVVVVDDDSDDGTVAHLKQRYIEAILADKMLIVQSPINLGVTGAKNLGYKSARGEWTIFLDSDDAYVDGAGTAMGAEMAASNRSPLIFFRCIDETGRFVGDLQNVRRVIDLHTYLRYTSFGEALTAVNKSLCGASPPYVAELRGYEGLGCARLIEKHGAALLSDVVGRIYTTEGDDRLSSARGMLKRMPLLARGHYLMVSEFGRQMSITQGMALVLKASVYRLAGLINGIIPKG